MRGIRRKKTVSNLCIFTQLRNSMTDEKLTFKGRKLWTISGRCFSPDLLAFPHLRRKRKKKKRDELFLSLHKCLWGWREEELFDDDDVFMQAPDASPPA